MLYYDHLMEMLINEVSRLEKKKGSYYLSVIEKLSAPF